MASQPTDEDSRIETGQTHRTGRNLNSHQTAAANQPTNKQTHCILLEKFMENQTIELCFSI